MTDVPVPDRIAALKRDLRGYYVPWFVEWIDGVPDFRVVDSRKALRAVSESRCFICGEKLGRFLTFAIGPMCAVNRISAEPPSHRECAVYSARVCPFLSNPAAPRRGTALPEEIQDAPGVAIKRNPGVTLLWSTLRYSLVRVDGGALYSLGDPTELLWFAEGGPRRGRRCWPRWSRACRRSRARPRTRAPRQCWPSSPRTRRLSSWCRGELSSGEKPGLTLSRSYDNDW